VAEQEIQMSEILTAIGLPGLRMGRSSGLMEWGRKTRPEMIALYRHQAELDKAASERILAASDDEFRVRVVRGPIVQHLVEEL
jgi:hypothetical protein